MSVEGGCNVDAMATVSLCSFPSGADKSRTVLEASFEGGGEMPGRRISWRALTGREDDGDDDTGVDGAGERKVGVSGVK